MCVMARPKVHTVELRDRLLDLAVDITANDGFGALTVRTVASAAGTSTTAVYSLFGSMADLQVGVLVRAFDSFASAQESVGASDAPERDIAGLGMTYVQWALTNPRLFAVMFSPPAPGSRRQQYPTKVHRRQSPLLTTRFAARSSPGCCDVSSLRRSSSRCGRACTASRNCSLQDWCRQRPIPRPRHWP